MKHSKSVMIWEPLSLDKINSSFVNAENQ